MSSSRAKKPANTAYRVRFATVTSIEAANGRNVVRERPKEGLTAKDSASEILINSLKLTKNQKSQITELYSRSGGCPTEHTFTSSEPAQVDASSLLASYGLDIDSRDEPGNCWSVQWSSKAKRHIKSENDIVRVLFQCDSGYDHELCGSKKRNVPRSFTGCLAHAEVTFVGITQKILRIRGHLVHNDACKNALLTRIPALPLHPSVYRDALNQLAMGVSSFSIIQKNNREKVKNQAYPDMPHHTKDWKHRWLLERQDSCSLYRQFARMQGIKTKEKPHINVQQWLDPKSPQFNRTFHSAFFHFSARTQKEERFEACIATDEMHKAAWKYGQHSGIYLDGTFGLCDKKILCFIVMAIDEDNHGIPLAFLFFSAPSGNAHTAAGYDSKILTKLIGKWKESVEKSHPGHLFSPPVATTDTDLKERIALVNVFPSILLLICRVHLRRSWKNHRTKCLKGQAPLLAEIRARLKAMETKLIEITNYPSARALIIDEISIFEEDAAESQNSQYSGAVTHLQYLLSYWLAAEDLWASWSDFGRRAAAKILLCPIEKVPMHTNHLESFNRVLKYKYIGNQRHGGRRLRLDVMLHFIVLDMIPSILEQRQMERAEKERQKHWVMSLPGGVELWEQRRNTSTGALVKPVAFFSSDAVRDEEARKILAHAQISAPTSTDDRFTFTCYSSTAMAHDHAPIIYQLSVSLKRLASCTCPDFTQRGGACKHIRAALMYLDMLRDRGIPIPIISLPCSEQEARLQLTNLALQATVAEMALPQQPTTHAAEKLDELLRAEVDVDEMSDSESVERNGYSDEGYSEEGDSNSISIPSDDGEFNFTMPAQSAHLAISQQALSRVMFELNSAAPKLAELGGYLASVDSLSQTENSSDIISQAQKARDNIWILTEQLDRLLFTENGTSHTPLSSISSYCSSPSNPVRKCKADSAPTLAPSPEKSQKRKDSHSCH